MNLELNFRLASSSDFDEILKLSEGIYDGDDYLPLRYHTWMKMKNVAVMLAYSGEKLVSLVVCCVVDEGRTWVARAARTLQEFQGQGVANGILQATRNQVIRRHFLKVRRQLRATRKIYPSRRKIVQRDSLRFPVVKATLRSYDHHAKNDSVQIKPCTKDYLCDVIFSPPVTQKLFPDNIIIVEAIPIKPSRSNIDLVAMEGVLCFAVDKGMDSDLPRSVSFGVFSSRMKYLHWHANVYTSDPVLYEAHLLYQFKRACEVIKTDFIFHSFQDKSVTNHARRVLKERLQVQFEEELPLNVYEFDEVQQSHL